MEVNIIANERDRGGVGREGERQTDRQTGRQADRQAGRQAGRRRRM